MTTEMTWLLDQIRQRLPLTDYLVSKGYALRQTAGNRMVSLCPFHADRHRPNLIIYADEQRFHCFCCGAHGDIVDVVQRLEDHPDFSATLHALAGRLRIPWRSDLSSSNTHAYDILTLATKLYAEKLSPEVLEYLGRRGFSEPFVRKWHIGHAPQNAPQFLRNLLKEHHITPEAALASGVVVEMNSGGSHFVRDFFANSGGGYIIFPNPGPGGAALDLQGRAFPESGKKPKYLNLPRSRRHLFNESILPQASIVLTEGIPDAMSCSLVNLPAVAVYGTAGFPDKLVNKLMHCRRVYVAFDIDARHRSIQVAMQFGLRGRVVALPEALGREGDLNDMLVQQGAERFRAEFTQLLRAADTAYGMALSNLPADLEPCDLFEAAAPVLAALGAVDPINRDAHLQRLHIKYGIAMETLRSAATEALHGMPTTKLLDDLFRPLAASPAGSP